MGIRVRVWLWRWMVTLGHRVTRWSPSVGAVLRSTVLYLRLKHHLQAREANRALSTFLTGSTKRPSNSKGNDWISRLLLAQLEHIENLRNRIGERRSLQEGFSRSLVGCAGVLSANGRLILAEKFFEAATRHLDHFSVQRIEYVRTLGITRFMQGKIRNALPCFAEVAATKHMLRNRSGVPSNIRMLGDSWFVAIGHVAMIDFLLKKQKLGWEDRDVIFVSCSDLRSVPGQTLLLELRNLGIRFGWPENMKTVFDQLVEAQSCAENIAQSGGGRAKLLQRDGASVPTSVLEHRQPRKWDFLESVERTALIEEFWESGFSDGEYLLYGHAAAKIQNRWEAENRPPNFVRQAEADAALSTLRWKLGIPKDTWYACLHVRQSSFHDRWNTVWEQARDADIRTYSAAIRAIVERGGYVVRMGDPTMPPLPPMEGAIDYARSEFKSEYADILLLSGARFFVGTNSGLSIIPGIYGVPCVLTNWIPIGIPNWFGSDLMIPKLLRHQDSCHLVSLEEMLFTNLGYVQNPRDLPAGLEVVDNTPEELAAVVTQMLCELDGEQDNSRRDRSLEEAYFALAVKHGGYRGSRIGTAFMHEHGKALGFSWKDLEVNCQAASNTP